MKLEFSQQIFEKKKAQISSFIKLCQVGVELFHANGRKDRQTDGRMDMTKLTTAFRNFANVPKSADWSQ